MSKIFCVGDIHGCSATLEDLLINEMNICKKDKLIFIGDYIDRGEDSKSVIDIIIELYSLNFDVVCLLGNHEDMFMESSTDQEIYQHWVTNCGGRKTLDSFNITSYQELDEKYVYFFNTLLHHHTLNNKYILVHAGLNFSKKSFFEDKYSILWKRGSHVDHLKLGNKKIIHGHTPQAFEKTQNQLDRIDQNKIINIDNGCVFTQERGLGKLTALELTEMKLYSVYNNCKNSLY